MYGSGKESDCGKCEIGERKHIPAGVKYNKDANNSAVSALNAILLHGIPASAVCLEIDVTSRRLENIKTGRSEPTAAQGAFFIEVANKIREQNEQ